MLIRKKLVVTYKGQRMSFMLEPYHVTSPTVFLTDLTGPARPYDGQQSTTHPLHTV